MQSGRKNGRARTGKGNPYLKSALAQMATGAAKTDTFLGERYRRLIKRMPKAKALVALQRSILVIIFHLLADPTAEFTDLGSDFYQRRIDRARRTTPPAAPAPRPGLPGPAHRDRPPNPTSPAGHQLAGPASPSPTPRAPPAAPAVPFARPRLGFPVRTVTPAGSTACTRPAAGGPAPCC